ncbi:hypothetical protein [Amycolatopsis sp. CA-126428]|uniref:hypothetical protein n=1 Tax=Amycolatopsis sp. CA-126428 TaxID=2073158 RepID=UPI000CD16E15|nr:hypothetical protein [Amycolatopsis sp. CA-126428]
MDPDHAILTRLRDLAETLPGDVAWLTGPPLRADGLRDLGERLSCLGADLISRAGVLDEIAAARLPSHGWIPECGPEPRRRLSHYVGRGEVRLGLIYFASCGAGCFPFYGTDPAGRTERHERCEKCVKEAYRLMSVPPAPRDSARSS